MLSTEENGAKLASNRLLRRYPQFRFDLGHQGGFVTLAERTTRLYLALPIRRKTAEIVTQGVIKLLEPMAAFVHTITYDNGREFSLHDTISKALNCKGYFAQPYHSWERGLNEQSNGLLRRFFPKSMALDNVSEKETLEAINALNNRPRKCLDYKTPWEAFVELTQQKPVSFPSGALMT